MKIRIREEGRDCGIDTSKCFDISIPVNFNGPQPNTYDVNPAQSKAYEAGSFIGDTRRGGGCNFEQLSMIPHCNGTHTECVGHISLERIHVNSVFNELLIPSALVTVVPVSARQTADTYSPPKQDADMLITASSLEEVLSGSDSYFFRGLILRTLPNPNDKKSRRYSENNPPFFSTEAMELISSLNIMHLLVDIPSVDRTFDEGKLHTHHTYWNVEQGSHSVDPQACSLKTITEMVYADNDIPDGYYFTSIQIPDFCADAAPSRVKIYPLTELCIEGK